MKVTKNTLYNPIFLTDGYKLCHKDQYPKGTEWVYETWTPRMSRIEGINHVVFYGLQGALQELTELFDHYFFKEDLTLLIEQYKALVADVFCRTNAKFAHHMDTRHIEDLHKLGYLPIKVKAVQEGTFVPIGVPMFTLENTLPEFFWLPGYLESQLSSYIWSPMTAATIADYYKRILVSYAKKTSDEAKVFSQAGDFSMRGMSSPESAMRVAGGHLLSFGGSATISARNYLMHYYDAKGETISYTPSTEHSVMCSYGEDEYKAYKHLITEVYPSGNISIVSDTYDLWEVIDQVLPLLKEEILNREGKVIIRPDSGEPIDILCGDPEGKTETIRKGVIQRLYEIFGGHINEKGYIELNSKIGAVYGDSITPERTMAICQRLMEKGYATTNASLGIGSYTYQYNTRDTFGFALKGTAEIENGVFKMIQKRPATDTGNFKTSQKGMVAVVEKEGNLTLVQGLVPEGEKAMAETNLLKEVYRDGVFFHLEDFETLREKVARESNRVYKEVDYEGQ